MDLADFREYCLTKPGVTEGTPFGDTVLVFKVGGKMFAFLSLDEVPTTANLKCDPDFALELRDRFEQVQPGYHMNKKHWNTVEIDTMPEPELRKMIDHSYELVMTSLPRLVAAAVTGGRNTGAQQPKTAAATPKGIAAAARQRGTAATARKFAAKKSTEGAARPRRSRAAKRRARH